MTQQDILKMAGVKNSKELYAKFPTHESFMAKYGKQIKKAFPGVTMPEDPKYGFNPSQYDDPTKFNLMGDPSIRRQAETIPLMQNSQQRNGFTPLAVPALQDNKLAPINKGSGLGKMAGFTDLPGKIVKGIQNIKEEKKARLSAETWENVSKVNLDASRSEDVDAKRQLAANMTKKRQMMMPVNTGEEFFPIYGVGTENLSKNGKKIKGQIQNTYAPKTLYDDLGYAQAGIGIPGADIFGQATSMAYGENAGSQLGGDLGSAVGSIFGPAGSMVGSEIGKFAGYALDQNPEKMKRARENTQKNVGMMAMNSWGKSLQGQNQAFMEDGGSSSQVINRFGNHTMRDLLRLDPTMNTLRAGGHLQNYTAPSERALQTFDMGGDLQVHSGGYAEPMSNNPYSQSPTVMFRGASHAEGGIDMTYGKAPVEVERGEPAQEFADGGKEKSLVVFGNLKPSKAQWKLAGLPELNGQKVKNAVNKISKEEAKYTKLADKSIDAVNNSDAKTSHEKLTEQTYAVNFNAAKENLKRLAQKKETIANLQQAINDTAEEHGLVADDLAKGNVKYAKLGNTVHKAVDGSLEKLSKEDYDYFSTLYKRANETKDPKLIRQFQEEFSNKAPNLTKKVLAGQPLTNYGKAQGKTVGDVESNWDSRWGPRTEQYLAEMQGQGYQGGEQIAAPDDTTDLSGFTPVPMTNMTETPEGTAPTKEKFDWMKALGSMMPYLRPSDTEQLEGRQMAGEMFAMSNNQQEPVPLQTFQPQLTVPYDISFQDQLNENQATLRGAQRMAGANPAAQANLVAQQYQANQRVLGEQFRQNQGMKNQTYAQNRQALDSAQLRNLQAYDQQATRQAQAKSNTKEVTQAALSSISDKFLKNQLSNRTLQTYENLYNYRFDPRMRAQNWNAPAQWDTSGAMARAQSTGPEGMLPTFDSDEYGNPVKSGYKKIKTKAESGNGSIVSSFKHL